MNIVSIVSNLKAVIELLPTIISAVKSIEEQFPESGIGRQKLELVRNILESVYDNVDDFNSVWPYINKTINAAVAFMKSANLFVNSK